MSEAELFISVVVPCYNQAEFLSEALESVLIQTYINWECIIVNDGSPDNTREIALEWCQRDTRFKYLEIENAGVSTARNQGITVAKGTWVLPLDGDDKIANNYLELAVNAIIKDPELDLIYCKAENFGEVTGDFKLNDYNFQTLLCDNLIFCTAFFKKEAWTNVGGYDTELKHGREDWEFWINILNFNSKVLCLNNLCFYYRRKKISRDVLFNQDRNLFAEAEIYIFEKHKDKYFKQFGPPQENLKRKKQLEDRINAISEVQLKIHHNIFARLLYKIIKIII